MTWHNNVSQQRNSCIRFHLPPHTFPWGTPSLLSLYIGVWEQDFQRIFRWFLGHIHNLLRIEDLRIRYEYQPFTAQKIHKYHWIILFLTFRHCEFGNNKDQEKSNVKASPLHFLKCQFTKRNQINGSTNIKILQ